MPAMREDTAMAGGTVVHLVPAMEQGGVETVVCDLNRELVRAGWRSVVVSRGGRLVERVRADGGEHVALDLKSKNPLTALPRAWRLRRVLREVAAGERRDARDRKDENDKSRRGDVSDLRDGRDARIIVCAHSRVPAWLFVIARRLDSIIRLFDYSIISPSRSPFPIPHSQNSIIRLFDYSIISSLPFITYAHGANSVSRYSAVMTKGDVVVAPSRFLAGFLLENYGKSDCRWLAERIRVIHPAVDFVRFDPAKVDAKKVAALRREWGIADGERVVMAVGRITPLKGFDHLIRDLAGRSDVEPDAGWGDVLRSPQAKLVLVGGADSRHLAYEAELKTLAASLGVAGRVVFAGQRDCVPECLAAADVVVSGNAAKPESFGLSVAEALAMERPVRLLRRFGGAAEILDEAELSGATTRREAVRALCSPQEMARATLAAYAEAEEAAARRRCGR